MTQDEKKKQIDAGQRVRCMVPFCQRTSKMLPEEMEKALRERTVGRWQWLCGKHWRLARPMYRRAHRRYQKKYGVNFSPFWKRIVDEAITKGGL